MRKPGSLTASAWFMWWTASKLSCFLNAPVKHTVETALAVYSHTCGRCGLVINGYRRALGLRVGGRDQWNWDRSECYAICQCPNCHASFSVPKLVGTDTNKHNKQSPEGVGMQNAPLQKKAQTTSVFKAAL